MKAGLIVAAGVAIAASTAAAANFDINAADAQLDDVSSATSTIADCTGGLTADLLPGDYDATAKDWALDTVRVSSSTDGLSDRCDGFVVSVVIERDGLATVALTPQTIDASDVLDFPVTDVLVRPTDQLSVLVDEPNL